MCVTLGCEIPPTKEVTGDPLKVVGNVILSLNPETLKERVPFWKLK